MRFLPSPRPFVLETHGGKGRVWQRIYSGFDYGAVIEKDAGKVEFLSRQRPGWMVYEGKAEDMLSVGLFRWQSVDLLDVDPYGEPWPVIEAFFKSERIFADTMMLAVNDGLRQNARIKGSWKVKSLQKYAAKYGADNVRRNFLEICREKVLEITATAGYSVDEWRGYYCGNYNDMTHYGAILRRGG